MHNISPARAMARQAQRLFTTGIIAVLGGLVLLALGVLLIIIPVARAQWYTLLDTALLVGGAVVLLVGGVFVYRGLTFPADNEYARLMGEALANSLDYRYTFVRNINKRGLGYIDAVLIGPNGALVFYFFHRPGTYYNEGNLWFSQQGGQLQTAPLNPTREVVKDVTALREFLAERNLAQVPVYAVVVVPRRETIFTLQNPIVPVAYMQTTLNALRDNYLAAERITPPQAEAVVRALMEN